MSAYWDFIHAARDLYGFETAEAREFYRAVREELGVAPTVEDVAGVGFDVFEEGWEDIERGYREEEEQAEEYELGPPDADFELEWDVDDDILWPDDEVEITVEHSYYRGK